MKTLTLAAILALGASAQSSDDRSVPIGGTAPSSTRTPGETPPSAPIVGTVKSVNADAIVVEGPDGTSYTLAVDKGTQLTRAGVLIQSDDLRPGDEVRVILGD